MNRFRNHVQLIGNIGDEPKITPLEGSKKVCRFPLATNEYYKNAQGDKVQSTDWHTIVAWGKTAEIIEKYAKKGDEIGIIGKIKTRSFEGEDGNQRYVTEIVADEVLLLGEKSKGNNGAKPKKQEASSKAEGNKAQKDNGKKEQS